MMYPDWVTKLQDILPAKNSALKLLIWFIYLLAIKIRKLFRPLIISLATIIYFYDMSW